MGTKIKIVLSIVMQQQDKLGSISQPQEHLIKIRTIRED
jgi:hypothetical protein